MPYARISSLLQHHHAQAGMVPRLSGSPDDTNFASFGVTCLPHRQPRGFSARLAVRATGVERL